MPSTKMELSSSTTNPLVKTKKKVEAKQIAAASRIQRFWRNGRNRLKWKKTAEGLRNRQNQNFATGVLVVMFMLQVASLLVHWYTGIYIGAMAVDLYLLVLVWASTFPLKSTWDLIIGLVFSFVSFLFVPDSGDMDNTSLIISWLVLLALVVLLYWLFKSMKTTLQHTYAADIHGLSARLSAKVIAGLPILRRALFFFNRISMSYLHAPARRGQHGNIWQWGGRPKIIYVHGFIHLL